MLACPPAQRTGLTHTDISQYRRFLGSFYRLCFFRSGRQPSYEVKIAVMRGTNSISNFDYHNVNAGAVENTLHDITGRSLVWELYPWDTYGFTSRAPCLSLLKVLKSIGEPTLSFKVILSTTFLWDCPLSTCTFEKYLFRLFASLKIETIILSKLLSFLF
jgi:hypothetical protein